MSDGEGLGFMGSLALGMIAADTITRDWPRQAAEAGAARRHRQEIAEQENEINAVILQYNQLVQEFNYVFDCAKQWEGVAEKRKEKIAQLKQDLAAANQRTTETEARAADFKSRYEYYHARCAEMGGLASQDGQKILELLAEIKRLKNR